MDDLSFVVLAAGIGSRFGGDKQLVDVGPSGETLLDYAIADAVDAGFGRVVLVVRSEIEDLLVGHVREYHPMAEVVAVRQDEHGPSREKPWGTAHAVLAVRDAVPGGFVVANADDFYGASSYRLLADFLGAGHGDDQLAIVGFRLASTLSDQGPVTRGVLRVGDDGRLTAISEERGVARDDDGRIVTATSPDTPLADDTPVSMNLWGLTPKVFELLEDGFAAFRGAHADDPGSEYLVPEAVGDFAAAGEVDVHVLRTDADWFGLTHADDLPGVRAEVARLVAAGRYAPDLRDR